MINFLNKIYSLIDKKLGIKTCEKCGLKKKFVRYVECYDVTCCYLCFVKGLESEAESMFPPVRVDQLSAYVTEGVWEELCEREQ